MDDDVKMAVHQWLKNLAADFYENKIQKLVVWYDKRLYIAGYFTESTDLSCNKVKTDALVLFNI